MKKARSIYIEESDFSEIAAAAAAKNKSLGDYIVDLFRKSNSDMDFGALVDSIEVLGGVYASLRRAVGAGDVVATSETPQGAQGVKIDAGGKDIKEIFCEKYEIVKGMSAVNISEVDSFITARINATHEEIKAAIEEMGGRYIDGAMGRCYLRVARL